MKKHSYLLLILIIIVLGIIALIVCLSTVPFDTTLEFQIRDRVSKNWVWDATMTLQNRTIRGYFQSDRGPRDFRFTHLEPGDWTLEVSAPAYESVSVPVTLKRGRNRIEDPIDMMGLEIPSLKDFVIFEELTGEDIICEIRTIGMDDRAVLNHPCLDIWIGARVTVQMKNGLIVQIPTEEGSFRGEELFRGKIEWEWDPRLETVFRYSARIPGARIKNHEAPFRVIDYLLIVPNPKATNAEEIEKIVHEAWDLTTLDFISTVLDQYADTFTYYIHSSWNVKGAE